MRPDTTRLKITFAERVPIEEVEQFVATGFGGFGGIARSDEPRTIFLVGIHWPFTFDVVTAQLSALQRDGVLKWEQASP
jgi:hypothetical protein